MKLGYRGIPMKDFLDHLGEIDDGLRQSYVDDMICKKSDKALKIWLKENNIIFTENDFDVLKNMLNKIKNILNK